MTEDIKTLEHLKFETKILNVHLTKLQYKTLRRIALQESMFQARKITMSEVVRNALAAYAATHEKRQLRRDISTRKEKL